MIAWGALWPSGSAMKSYIEIEFKKAGLDRTLFSDACIKELADEAVKLTEALAQFEKGVDRLVNIHLEERASTIAHVVYWISVGRRDYTAKDIKAEVAKDAPNWVWQILAKHHPERYSLDRLELTQMHNAALREAISESHSNKPPF
jgi:hypothetical protein